MPPSDPLPDHGSLSAMKRQCLLQSTTSFAPARALLQSTIRRTALHLKKALEEGSSTDAACSSDD